MIISRLVRSGRSPCSCGTDEGLGRAVILESVSGQEGGFESGEAIGEPSEIGPVVIFGAATGSAVVSLVGLEIESGGTIRWPSHI